MLDADRARGCCGPGVRAWDVGCDDLGMMGNLRDGWGFGVRRIRGRWGSGDDGMLTPRARLGFTLVEVLVAIVVAGVVAACGVRRGGVDGGVAAGGGAGAGDGAPRRRRAPGAGGLAARGGALRRRRALRRGGPQGRRRAARRARLRGGGRRGAAAGAAPHPPLDRALHLGPSGLLAEVAATGPRAEPPETLVVARAAGALDVRYRTTVNDHVVWVDAWASDSVLPEAVELRVAPGQEHAADPRGGRPSRPAAAPGAGAAPAGSAARRRVR